MSIPHSRTCCLKSFEEILLRGHRDPLHSTYLEFCDILLHVSTKYYVPMWFFGDVLLHRRIRDGSKFLCRSGLQLDWDALGARGLWGPNSSRGGCNMQITVLMGLFLRNNILLTLSVLGPRLGPS